MESLQVPRPAWMSEDLVLLEEQARRFLASELVPHVEKWTEGGMMERSAWDKLGQAGLLCAGIPDAICNGDGGLLEKPGTIQPLSQLSNPRATAANADFLKAGTSFTPQRSLRLGVRIMF